MFFGKILKDSQPFKSSALQLKIVVLTNAVLVKGDKAQIFVKKGKDQIMIGRLQKNKQEHMHFEFYFNKFQDQTILLKGNAQVHVAGYYNITQSDIDYEDLDEQLLQSQDSPQVIQAKKPEIKKNNIPAKKVEQKKLDMPIKKVQQMGKSLIKGEKIKQDEKAGITKKDESKGILSKKKPDDVQIKKMNMLNKKEEIEQQDDDQEGQDQEEDQEEIDQAEEDQLAELQQGQSDQLDSDQEEPSIQAHPKKDNQFWKQNKQAGKGGFKKGGFNKGDKGGYKGNDFNKGKGGNFNKGGFKDNFKGGYKGDDKGGYKGGDRGGYKGGYKGGDKGGYKGGNKGGNFNKGDFHKGGGGKFNKGGFNKGGGKFNKGGFNKGGNNKFNKN